MEVLSVRAFRAFSRLVRKPVQMASYNSLHTALKEDVNVQSLISFNEDIKAGGIVPVFRRALLFPTRVALQDELGIYTYAGLHQAAATLSHDISGQLGGETGTTVAYMCSNDASHVIVQWAIWMSGNIAVPLTPLHPPAMLQYFLTDSSASLVICSQEHANLMRPLAAELSRPFIVTTRDKQLSAQLYQPDTTFMKPRSEDLSDDVGKSNSWYGSADAMLIYTSGTTSKPKGVVWTHKAWSTQIAALQTAWQYSANDVVLHTLPLHHVHGQLNSLNASLAAGARIRMLPSFTSHGVWARLLGMGDREETKVTVFHGVPAMYMKLVADHDKMFASARTAEYVRAALASRMRLMCAGSASLPPSLFQRWEEISGLRLLERYGMTEVGMALSNPYGPAAQREIGCVGLPLPGVSARLAVASPDRPDTLEPLVTVECPVPALQISMEKLGITTEVKDLFADPKTTDNFDWKQASIEYHVQDTDSLQGELLLKGPGVFQRYWNRAPQLASKDFTTDGWFRTGDTASFSDNKFRILGRTSVDIIKTGGYKVSALQVEAAILEHPRIADAGVVGVEDPTWGETVSAAVVLKPGVTLTLAELKEWSKSTLAPYQIPNALMIVEQLPRNHMGKLDKKQIATLFAKK